MKTIKHRTLVAVICAALALPALALPVPVRADAGTSGSKILVDGASISTISPRTGNWRKLVDWRGGPAEYSPDRSKIALLRYRRGLWVMRADGTRARRVAGGAIHYFDWAPGSRNLVFQRLSDPTSGDEGALFRVNISGGDPQRLTSGRYIDEEPLWSPAGNVIVFRRLHDLYVINADGTDIHPLYDQGETGQFHASISPDGSSIVYVTSNLSVEPTRHQIERVDIDGSGHQVLASYNLPDPVAGRTRWSPDGRKIAFDRYGSKNTIYVMKADGSNKKQLVSPRLIQDFDWSPNSRSLAYVWRRDGLRRISIVHARTGNKRNLAKGRHSWSHVDWE